MSEENSKITDEKLAAENIVTVKNESTTPDMSNVKIRDVLKHRSKNWNPGLKMAIPIILVGIICFGAGLAVDRFFIGRRAMMGFRNRPGFNQMMPNKGFNKNNRGIMRNNQKPNTQKPTDNSNQSSQ